MRVSTGAKNPQRYKDADETSKMQAKNHALDKREVFGEEGVEEGDKEHHGNGEEGSVPSLVDVIVVVEDNQALNLGCRQEASD